MSPFQRINELDKEMHEKHPWIWVIELICGLFAAFLVFQLIGALK